MTSIIGQSASATPSKVEVNASIIFMFQMNIASNNVIKKAMGHALWPAILSFPNEIISQTIGIQAKTNKMYTVIPLFW